MHVVFGNKFDKKMKIMKQHHETANVSCPKHFRIGIIFDKRDNVCY